MQFKGTGANDDTSARSTISAIISAVMPQSSDLQHKIQTRLIKEGIMIKMLSIMRATLMGMESFLSYGSCKWTDKEQRAHFYSSHVDKITWN